MYFITSYLHKLELHAKFNIKYITHAVLLTGIQRTFSRLQIGITPKNVHNNQPESASSWTYVFIRAPHSSLITSEKKDCASLCVEKCTCFRAWQGLYVLVWVIVFTVTDTIILFIWVCVCVCAHGYVRVCVGVCVLVSALQCSSQ